MRITYDAQGREVMKAIKQFFKEIKRVRWPKAKETNKTFVTSLIFIIATSLILFSLAVALTALWSAGGVGLNG